MYQPQLDDYVKWNKKEHTVEGWVYFVDTAYITIETRVIPKNPEDLQHGTYHQNNHCLVVCYPEAYHQLEYVKNRRLE